ncbi:MAG: Rne/Rng family ribonuclease, partial [Solirubrobacterales bacterium]|nr:Rne/Rng family ribonuclease [Solirubrobacterales bacterium]
MKKKILVSVDSGETRVAVLEGKGSGRGGRRRDGKPQTASDRAEAPTGDGAQASNGGKGAEGMRVGELYVERRGVRSIVGNIYMGVVDNVLPGMEAAFVDIGLERNGFLHVDEIVTADGQPAPKRGRGKGRRIDEMIKPKQEILVQVVKDPLKTKGARLSMQLSIAGRYLVYMPQGSGVGASRRLSDAERDRQRKLLGKLHKGDGGVIVRTAAEGAEKADFERDLAYLHKLHEVVEKRAKEIKGPNLVFQEADLSIRVLRDVLGKEFDGAIIDDPKQHHRVTAFFQRTAPALCDLVELYEGRESLFERYGADKAIRSTLSRRVDLPSGGYLIIDYAEALTVIDINTGSFTGRGKGRLEDTITKVNVEAADEVVRQLRLRDIGGIIVIDFIDMSRARNRDQVLKTLQKALDEDRTKTYVMEVSPLGLVEMTRQNVTDGVREILTRKCPTCDGEGVIPSEETVAIDVLRKLRELVADGRDDDAEAYLVRVNPGVAAELVREESGLADLEEESGRWFHFEGGDALAIDTFEVTDRGTRTEIEERALPFAVGEEVLVTIEEPHMYDVDDAIARLDAYIVSVAGGGRHVGERRLVRIDSVSRSAANASLVDPEGPPSGPASDGGASEGSENGSA